MNNGTFAAGMIDVMRYTNHDLAKNVKGVGQGVCLIGGAVGRAIGGVFGLVARALK